MDNKFAIKKLQKLEESFVVFSPLTRMPYVACDPETFDDEIYLFAQEEDCRAYIKTLNEEKTPASALKILHSQLNVFLNSLYALDVNAVLFDDGAGKTIIALEDLVKRPDMEKLTSSKIPVINPRLTLTMIYFLQELRRQAPHEMAHLRELEEEMIANLVKSTFILGIETINDEENTDPEKVNIKNVRIPFVKTKEGDIYQPLYTDFSEFRKYTGQKGQKQRMSTLTFKQLPQFLIKQSKGYVLNPASVNLVLTADQIKRIIQDFF